MKIADKIITIVCDDIRQESGGKLSYMGVYHDLILSTLPTTLLKLSISFILEKIRIPIKNVKVTISFPKDELRIMPLDKPPAAELGKNLIMNLFIAPLHLTSEGIATIEAEFNEDKKTKIIHNFRIIHQEEGTGKTKE